LLSTVKGFPSNPLISIFSCWKTSDRIETGRRKDRALKEMKTNNPKRLIPVHPMFYKRSQLIMLTASIVYSERRFGARVE
jgi:hypothetical protein